MIPAGSETERLEKWVKERERKGEREVGREERERKKRETERWYRKGEIEMVLLKEASAPLKE